MSCSTKPAKRVDASPQVTRWRAEKARQEGRRSRDRGRERRYGWPADRTAIIAVTLAAGGAGNGKAEATATRRPAEAPSLRDLGLR